MNVLLLPQVLQRPAHCPAKKLFVPVPPVLLIQLTMLVELHTLNALAAVNGLPLIHKPVSSTFNLSQVPAANITVLDKLVVPVIEPIIVLLIPVVTAHPELHPTKIFLAPVVLQKPALRPKKLLSCPVVLYRPAY